MSTEQALQTSAIPQDGPRQIPIGDVVESDWNPRKYFPAAAHEKLVLSMREQGFWPWNALVGRPVENGFIELAAGHRRRRAALEAGLATVPVYVREMNDEEFLRVLTFDNSNREDPHPLDEAAGFSFFMHKTNAKVADIAAIIGQKVGYVYERLKCVELIDEGKKAFWEEKITSGQAVQIARLPHAEQKRTLKNLERCGYGLSVRDLANWIDREVHRDVSAAFFDKEDPNLVKGAQPCGVCPNRAGNSPAHSDLDPQTCTDPVCFRKKQAAFIQIKVEMHHALVKISESHYMNKRPADVMLAGSYREVRSGEMKCDFVRQAIVVDGRLGRMPKICFDPACPVHAVHSVGRLLHDFADNVESPAELAARKRQELGRQIDHEVGKRIPLAIVAKASVPFGRRELMFIIDSFFGGSMADLEALGFPASEPDDDRDDDEILLASMASASVDKLHRLLVRLAVESHGGGTLESIAEDFGVEVAALRKAVAAELAPVKKAPVKKPAAKKSAPKPAAKKPAKPAVKKAAKKK